MFGGAKGLYSRSISRYSADARSKSKHPHKPIRKRDPTKRFKYKLGLTKLNYG